MTQLFSRILLTSAVVVALGQPLIAGQQKKPKPAGTETTLAVGSREGSS